MEEKPFIVIGVPTFQRIRGLQRLLESLGALTIPENCLVEIMVVDNDPRCSAREIVEKFARTTGPELAYLSESQRGIAHARNRLLIAAQERGAEFLAFLDDDEVPGRGWLVNLLAVQKRWQADCVGGPVRRVFPPGTPDWFSRICFFEARQEKTGPTTHNIDTGNALLHLPPVKRMGLRFDEMLSLSGGEDLLFSCQARQRGARLAWAADAEVFEHVPASRLTRKWILKRAFRSGTVTVVVDRKIHNRLLTWGRNLGKALIYLLAGGVKLPFCLGGSPHRRYVPFIFWARAAGFMAGLAGYNYQEYQLPTGD